MPEPVFSNAADYVGQGIVRTMVCHLIEFVRKHGPALESIRINPTWLRQDEEEKQRPRRRKIWVHGTPPPPTGWELVEKCNFLEDLNIPQVLLDPCLSPNVVIASIADVVPRFVLGIIEHSPDPVAIGGSAYCPRCGLVGEEKLTNIASGTLFKCLNQLCDFEQYPIKKMPAQEQESVARRGLSLGTPRAPVTHPVPENVTGALEDIRRRSLYVDPAPNEDRTVLHQTETSSEGEERGPGRIDIDGTQIPSGTQTPGDDDDAPDSDEEGEDGSIRRSQLRERFANMGRGRLVPNQGLHTPAEHRREHDPLAQVLFDVERRAETEQERKRIQDIAHSYLGGRINGATVQRALQRIAREPKPGRGNRRR